MSETTRFDVDPQQADWYWCLGIDLFGETDYVDGYAAGDRPTLADIQNHKRCRHSWTAGMMYVHDEDVEYVAKNAAPSQPVECEKCEATYAQRDRDPFKVLEWEVRATPHGAHADAEPTGHRYPEAN